MKQGGGGWGPVEESMGLKPEVKVEVLEQAPFGGPLLLKVDGGEEHSLGLEVADHIYVALAEEAA